MCSKPVGTPLFGFLLYPFIPNSEPVHIMSYRPSNINSFILALASEHSCTSSNIRTVLYGTKRTFGIRADRSRVILSTLKSPANTFFAEESFLKLMYITFS